MTGTTIPPAELLRHAPWVQSLARALARDEHVAADLAQSTWAQVLQHPPANDTNLRGFLGTVLRNLWRQDRRAAARRPTTAAPDAEATTPPTADVVERAAAQRAIVDLVLALDEPYRSTVLLRYFDGEPVRRVAVRQGVPAATVRTRLQRALQQLRAGLAARGGRARALLLAPWLARPLPVGQPPVWPLLSVLAMNTKLALGIGVAAAAGLLLVTQLQSPPGAPTDTQMSPATGAPAAASTGERIAGAVEPAPQRQLVDTPVAPPTAPTAPEAATTQVLGVLRDAEDRPLADRQLVFRSGAQRRAARSDRNGAFEIAVQGAGQIEIDESGWTTVFAAIVAAPATPRQLLVVAAPAVRLGGEVVDGSGAPVPESTLTVVLPDGFRARFSAIADAAAARTIQVTSDARGAFAMPDAPAVEGASLLTAHPSFLPDRRPLPQLGDRALRIVLQKPTAGEGGVQGQVVDSRGAAVAEAWVAIGQQSVRAGADGSFALPKAEGDQLLAAKQGLAPARVNRPADGWPPFVLVQLDARALAIHGRVLDGDGAPVAGARVWVTNATQFGGRSRERAVVEGLAVADAAREQILARLKVLGAGVQPDERPRQAPSLIWPWTLTAADGSFELGGLFDRAYDLRAMVDENLLWVDRAAVPAGARGVDLRLPKDGTFAEIRGRVVDRSGKGVQDVRMAPMCDAVRVGGSTMHVQARPTRTDADGAFALRDVPKQTAYLRLDGEDILPLEHGRGVPGGLLELTGGEVLELVITVRRRLHVQIELSDPALADAVQVLDADGKQLMIDVFEGRSRNTVERLPFANGRTPVFVVPDVAAMLVLWRGTEAVRREAVTLVGGDVNRLRY